MLAVNLKKSNKKLPSEVAIDSFITTGIDPDNGGIRFIYDWGDGTTYQGDYAHSG